MKAYLSVIVPCYNVEAYVEHCLNSLVSQYFDGLELIVIDDASTDGTWERIDQYKSLPFVTIVRGETNRGLGAARNRGIELSRGEYLLFVDSDDWLMDGAINELVRCARETGPELVFFDYARVYAKAGAFSSPYSDLFKRIAESGSGDDRKSLLLDFGPMAWFKLYRRDFVVSSGIVFGGGFYEDVSWTYPLTLLANRIEVLPIVLYCYRQRSGSILKSRDDRHLDLIAEYGRVLAHATGFQGGGFSQKMVSKAIEHYEQVLFVHSNRLTLAGRTQFLWAAHEQLSQLDNVVLEYAVSSGKSLASQMRRKAIQAGNLSLYLCAFVIFKMTYFLTRPFKLLGTYFSRRRIEV